jgi:hypothetical protein
VDRRRRWWTLSLRRIAADHYKVPGASSRSETLVCDSSFEWQISKDLQDHPCHGDCEDFDPSGRLIGWSISAGDEYIEQAVPNPLRYCIVCALRRFPFVGVRGTPRGDAIIAMQDRRYEDMRRKLRQDANAAKARVGRLSF